MSLRLNGDFMKLNPLPSAPAWRSALGALPAQAQTEIQWWHSMTAVNNEWVNDLAKDFNASQKDYKIVPTYKGSLRRVHDRCRGRLPRRQCAAHPAGVRGGHRHHDGQQGRDRARGPGDEGRRLQVRPRGLHARRGRLLHGAQRADAELPFNSSTTVFYINKDAFKAAGIDTTKPPRPGRKWRWPPPSSRPAATSAR
jgi:sn-glycerol 3-phosphate transport system substrate-binding protein